MTWQNGKRLRVRHPDYVIASPEIAVVANGLAQGEPDELNLIPYENIVRIEFLPPQIGQSGMKQSFNRR